MSNELVPVSVECQCPGTPHADGDLVYLRPKLGLAAGIELQSIMQAALQSETRPTAGEVQGQLVEAYLLHGIADWTLAVDEVAVPVTRETITEHLLSDFARAEPVADKADDLYYGPVLAPLVNRVQSFSRATSTSEPTSAPKNGSPKPRKRSKPSSTSTTPTASTAATTR